MIKIIIKYKDEVLNKSSIMFIVIIKAMSSW